MKYSDGLISERLNLVKGVADSEGPPLNIFQGDFAAEQDLARD